MNIDTSLPGYSAVKTGAVGGSGASTVYFTQSQSS